jgi:hypothetical protein
VSEREQDELPSDVRALLDEESRRSDPSAERVEHIRRGVLRRVERLSPSSSSASPSPMRRSSAPLWFVGGVFVGAAIIGALWRGTPPRSVVVTSVVFVQLDASSSPLAITVPSDAAPRDASSAVDSAVRVVSADSVITRRERESREFERVDPDVSLRAERELIETAQSALARRQWSDAIRACSAHLRRFARAQLVEEREAIWVQALAGDGRSADAWARAESFRQRFATSMLRSVVDRAAPPLLGRRDR